MIGMNELSHLYKRYPYPYCDNKPSIRNAYDMNTYPYQDCMPDYSRNQYPSSSMYPDSSKYDSRNEDCMHDDSEYMDLMDYGPEPFAINIEEATIENPYFRTALWTGKHLQITLMSIKVGGDIGFEVHPHLDQFLRIEAGEGVVLMGDRKDCMDFQERVSDDYAIVIPAGKWHNLINTGNIPLKLYSIYAPPEHPWGTVHETKEMAEEAHDH